MLGLSSALKGGERDELVAAIKIKILQLVGYHRQSLRSSIRIPDRRKSYIQGAETEKESKEEEKEEKSNEY